MIGLALDDTFGFPFLSGDLDEWFNCCGLLNFEFSSLSIFGLALDDKFAFLFLSDDFDEWFDFCGRLKVEFSFFSQ